MCDACGGGDPDGTVRPLLERTGTRMSAAEREPEPEEKPYDPFAT
jgi:hypothetical protein